MNRNVLISSLFWKMLERGGSQGIQLIVQIVLARALLPEMYGTIALVMVFVTLIQVFVQSGLGTALIQKKDADNIDFSSVFYVSLFLSVLLYALLFIMAPALSKFYQVEELTALLRVLGIAVFFAAVNGVQNAYISRNMLFRELFVRSLIALLFASICSIFAAYSGAGIWALVVQQLTYQIALTVILWFTIDWRPNRAFSLSRTKGLFSFGYKLLLSSLIDTLYREVRTLIIGKYYSPIVLGYYNKGEQFPKLIMSNIDGSIQAVMLPALSAHQDKKEMVKLMMRRAIMTSSFLTFPLMVGLAAIAPQLVRVLLTDRWMAAVPYLQIFCFSYIFWPMHTANLQAINALGRSDVFLKLEIIKKLIGVGILVFSIPMGVKAIAISGIVSGLVSSFINAWPNRELLNYSYTEQLKDILPSLGLSVIMGLPVYALGLLNLSDLLKLPIQLITGMFVYVLLARLCRMESWTYLVYSLRSLKKY